MEKNDCTVYRTMDFIGKRWTLLLLLELYKGHGTKRFNEIKKGLKGITSKILTMRLRELESDGLILRVVDKKTIPMICTYSLTESGLGLIDIVKDIKTWALKYKIKNEICSETDCQNCTIN